MENSDHIKRKERAYKQRVYREKTQAAKEQQTFVIGAAMKEAREIVDNARKEAEKVIESAVQHAKELTSAAMVEADGHIHAARAQDKLLILSRDKITRRLRAREIAVEEREQVTTDLEKELTARAIETGSRDLVVSLARKRTRDATRQRAYYSRNKQIRQDASQGCDASRSGSRASTQRVCKALVLQFELATKTFDVPFKKAVLDKFWQHDSLKSFMPELIAKPKLLKSLSAGMRDVRLAIQRVKRAKQKSELVSKRALLIAFSGKNVHEGRHKKALSQVLGMKRSNLDKGLKLRTLWDSEAPLESLWVRQCRSDKVSFEVSQVVQDFWERTTRVSPNSRDSVRQRFGPKLFSEHRVHWLEETQVEFYLRFQEWVKQPEQTHLRERLRLEIGLRTFEGLKPYFVRVLKDRIVCCCKQHVEMDLLKTAFNKMTVGLHAINCSCLCVVCRPVGHAWGILEPHCVAYLEPVTSVRVWCEKILCPNYCPHDKSCTCNCLVCRPVGYDWGSAEPHCLAYNDPIKDLLCPNMCDNGGQRLTEKYHKKACLMGKCKKCGFKTLKICDSEKDRSGSILVEWKAFEYIILEKKKAVMSRVRATLLRSAPVHDADTETGPDSNVKLQAKGATKRLQLVEKETTFNAYMEKLKSCMPLFIRHDFRYRWQAEAYRQNLAKFPRGSIVSTIDYAENYTFNVQTEIQSMHWVKKQITILVHITYRHRDDQALGVLQKPDDDRHIVADYHFYISDDNIHDSLFVQHCFDLHRKWMATWRMSYDFHYVWSDGCAAQFKSARPFYFVSRHHSTYGMPMMWNFFGSGHGKGTQDGLGGHVKSALAKEQLKLTPDSARLENAADAVSFLQKRFAVGKDQAYGEVQEVNRHFHLIGNTDVDRKKRWDCSAIEGSRQLHSFYGFNKSNPIQLKVKELACFCDFCVAFEFEKCVNHAYTGPWSIEMITPRLPSEVTTVLRSIGTGENMGSAEEIWEGGMLGELLEQGDYYAIEAATPNKWQAQFYVLHCLQPVYTVETAFTDAYGVKFLSGQQVIKGKWYQPWGRKGGCNNRFVEVKKSAPSWCLLESVIHIRFALIPERLLGADAQFTLDAATVSAILAALD